MPKINLSIEYAEDDELPVITIDVVKRALQKFIVPSRDMHIYETEDRLSKLSGEHEKMKNFILALFDIYFPECLDIDGEDIQDLGDKHGILILKLRHAPCGEHCACSEMCSDEEFKEGVVCYTLSDWLYE